MVRIYYHIYAIEGVESIIDEQIYLIEKYFNFPFQLNIGISIANENVTSKSLLNKIYAYNKHNYKIRDIRCRGNEFTTLDLIEEDRNIFGDSDYIFYLHTKGASKINEWNYDYLVDWRNLMHFFNIEKYNSVFKIFETTEYNTYGINLKTPTNIKKMAYFGNFWWAKANYIKTLDNKKMDKGNRIDAEFSFIQCGENWKPFTPFNSNVNHYYEAFPKEKYRQ